MVLTDVLSSADVARIQDALGAVPFGDGRATAGPAAGRVKHNEQARSDEPTVAALARSVRSALERHPTFGALARPTRWSRLLLSRHGPGHAYGLHTDDSTMCDEDGWPLRTDLSFTVFLSDPDTYDGGALVLKGLDGERELKPPAGSAVLYPTGQLHRVAPVTRGVRLACVGWVQSLIRRTDRRELLFDLERARQGIPEGEAQMLLDNAIGNLTRMWGEH